MSLNVQGFNQFLNHINFMKKSILFLGKSLTAVQQKQVNGGFAAQQQCHEVCPHTYDGKFTGCGFPHCPGYCDGNGGYVIY